MSDGTAVDIYEPVITDLKERIADLQATLENLERIRGNASIGCGGLKLFLRLLAYRLHHNMERSRVYVHAP